jgi:hypothetical protein|tara:strand:- start:9 stop:272 length:264 start_codon:yes stop_codon:yes gene_type:complete
VEHRGGAVLATSGLVVANENLGGDYFAYLVSALGGFAVFAGVLGTHGARGENGWCVVRRPSFLFFSARRALFVTEGGLSGRCCSSCC